MHDADAHDVELATGGGCTAGAICPPCATLRCTARSKEEGAPRDFAFPFAWPGAWVFAPTNATPKTTAVSSPIALFAVRARARASSMRESLAMRRQGARER